MIVVGVRVAVVGPHELAREGLRRILADAGFDVSASSSFERVTDDPGDMPHLIIVEANDMDVGVTMCAALKALVPGARLVLITKECNLESIPKALAIGVDGLLNNSIACEPLIAALRLIMMGEKVVPTQIVNALCGASLPSQPYVWNIADDVSKLSEREIEILSQLMLGEANKVISRRLMISEATVKVHVKAILRKLRVLNRTQAAIWAVHRGIAARASKASDEIGTKNRPIGQNETPCRASADNGVYAAA